MKMPSLTLCLCLVLPQMQRADNPCLVERLPRGAQAVSVVAAAAADPARIAIRLRNSGENRGCLSACLITQLLASAQIPAEVRTPQPPKEIRVILEAKYPGWKFARVSAHACQAYPFYRFNIFPDFLWGDFDGDGRPDYALQIEHPRPSGSERVVLAFLQRRAGFRAYVLETGAPSPDAYLWPHRRGEKDFDFSRNREFTYSNDAVGVVYGEVAGVSYVFEHGSFRKIVSSD